MNRTVSILDNLADWLISGVVNLSSYHPSTACLVIAMLAGSAYAVLLDLVTSHLAVFPLSDEHNKSLSAKADR